MARKSSHKDVRLQIILPFELKEKLRRMAVGKGKNVSALVRESVEEKVVELERQLFEESMREAYLDLADENVRTVEDFRHVDAEDL